MVQHNGSDKLEKIIDRTSRFLNPIFGNRFAPGPLIAIPLEIIVGLAVLGINTCIVLSEEEDKEHQHFPVKDDNLKPDLNPNTQTSRWKNSIGQNGNQHSLKK